MKRELFGRRNAMLQALRWCLGLLVLCLALTAQAQDFKSAKKAAEKGNAQGKNAPAAKSASGLPFTINAHGNSYTVTGYKIGKRAPSTFGRIGRDNVDPWEGKTEITLTGSGFEKIPKEGNNPFGCTITSNGNKYDSSATGVTRRNMVNDVPKEVEFVCILSTSADPDTIILYAQDNPDRKTKIQVVPGK